MGWFGVRFSNPIDKKQVWEGRPYHLFSQLLLLKPWSATFDPVSESIFVVDMWVRIPSFPLEYYNFESLSTILDFNNVPSLLRLDPNAPRRSWAKFARFCINLNCSKSVNKEILIPDEQGNMKKFNLWFEDIPQGCGSCGETDHSFTSCPLRKFIPPKFKITFKKPATGGYSVQIHESDDSGWKEVENKGKNKAETSNPLKENKGKQLDDFGGIGVIYITDDSSNEFQTGIEIDKHQAGQPVTTPCGDPIPNNTENQEEEVASPGNVAFATVDPNLFLLPPTIDQEDIMANQHYFEEFKKEQELDGADNNLFYYQEDENEVWANDQGDCIFEDQPYVEETTEANFNINNCQDLPVEDNSFHSLNSDNSMLKHLADMELMKAGQSTSGSGKRKINGGDGDTASSDLVGVKKPKI